MRMPHRRRDPPGGRHRGAVPEGEGGFTLLEITVALAIVTITAMGVMSCLTAGFTVDREATEAIASQNLARRLMEELLQAPFDGLMATYNNTQVSQDDLRAVIRVQQVAPPSGAPSLVRLQVAVRVNGDTSDMVKLVTLRADHRAPASAWRSWN